MVKAEEINISNWREHANWLTPIMAKCEHCGGAGHVEMPSLVHGSCGYCHGKGRIEIQKPYSFA